ncbi:hypothetical protein MASR1M45_15760 [Candidatus Kapaibacterium sp.]
MRLLYIIIVSMILFQITALSQYVHTPLIPAKDKIPGWNGFMIGLGQNFQSGEYYVDCEDCIFDGGVGTGFTLGASYDRKATDWLKYGIAVMYDYSGIQNAFSETEQIQFELENSGIKENININFRHTAQSDFHFINFMPYLKFEPWNFFFFRMGFGGALLLDSRIVHEKELMQRTVQLSNGAIVTVRIPNSNSDKVTIQDSQVQEVSNFNLYLMPASGFKIDFSETTYLMTYLQYSLPLNNISEFGKDYKINQWRIFLELGFKVH